MNIHDYCEKECCDKIKLRFEYILIHGDRFIFSGLNKKEEVDLQTTSKRRLISLVVILPLLFVFLSFMIWIVKQNSFLFILFISFAIFSLVIYFYYIVCETSIPIIQKEKIIKIYDSKWTKWLSNNRAICIKYEDSKNKIKIRRLLLPINKNELEQAIALLNKYNICYLNEK